MKRATTGNVNKGSQILISIHALVKRATIKGQFSPPPLLISIHALVKRATYGCDTAIDGDNDFNPRPREEGDFTNHDKNTTVSISIHALVKRATKNTTVSEENTQISIHALVKRATHLSIFLS